MISKELLSEVLDFDINNIKDLHISSKNNVVWDNSHIMDIEYINIYELAHKCKEWADSIGIELFSKKSICQLRIIKGGRLKLFKADTEIESIFKACEWILKEVNK